MERCSTTDSAFLDTAAQWIAEDGEVFVIIRHPNAGGTRAYEHIVAQDDFAKRVSQLKPATSVVVCKGQHLRLRGVVDDAFIDQAIATIPNGDEWLIVGQMPVNYGAAWWFPDVCGDSHAELESELGDDTFYGQSVFAGVVPPWWLGDSDSITSAYVPNADGSITPAAY